MKAGFSPRSDHPRGLLLRKRASVNAPLTIALKGVTTSFPKPAATSPRYLPGKRNQGSGHVQCYQDYRLDGLRLCRLCCRGDADCDIARCNLGVAAMSTSISVSDNTAALFGANLGSKHCRAICEEIGERLALVLRPATELPPRLRDLLDRLALLDHAAPSIVPDIEDMVTLEEISPVRAEASSILSLRRQGRATLAAIEVQVSAPSSD